MSSLVEGGKKRKKEKKKQPKRKRLKEAVDEDEDNEVRILNPLQNVLKFKQFAFPDGHCFFHTMYKCIRHIRPNFEFKMASPKQKKKMKEMAAPIKQKLKEQIKYSSISDEDKKEKEEGISFRIDLQCLVNIKKEEILEIFDQFNNSDRKQYQNDYFKRTFNWKMEGNLLSAGPCNYADAIVGTCVCLYLIDPKLKAYMYNETTKEWFKIQIKLFKGKIEILKKTTKKNVNGKIFFMLKPNHFVPLLPDDDAIDVILEVEPKDILGGESQPIELDFCAKLKF